MKILEHDIQVAYFDMVAWGSCRDDRLNAIFAIPNAGMRSAGALMYYLAEGLKSGLPDICIPVAVEPYNGAWIEFKQAGKKQTKKQVEWFERLQKLGHKCSVHYDAAEAYEWTRDYLGER